MKVSCQSCGAQYNLPDEKVRGRKAKVRCKKCTAQIIVDGTAAADDDEEATRVMQAPAASLSTDPTWTVNLSDEDQLDMTEAELLAGWRDGRVTDDAYVWREGMDEWLPILESPELAAAIRALDATKPMQAPNAAVQDFLGFTPSANTSADVAPRANESAPSNAGAPRPAGSSPTASEPSRPSVPSPKPKAQKSEDTSKAFSFALAGAASTSSTKKASRPPAAAQPKGGGLFGGPTPAPAPVASGSDIGGGTSENSVMFSLDALKAAAAVEPRKTLRAAANNEARVAEDVLTLGSPNRFDNNAMPLIDVEVPPPVARAEAPAFAPPIAPVQQQKKSSVGIWAIGLLAVVGMAGAYVLGSRGSDQPVATNGVSPARSADSEQPAAVSSAAEQSSAEPTTSTAAATSVTSAPPTVAGVGGSSGAGGRPQASGGGGGGGGGKTTEKPETKPDTTEKPSAGGKPAPTPPPAAKPSGPPFNVAAAKAALNSAAASSGGCRAPAGPSGTGKVQVTFAPSGNVTSALIISGPFGGTPVGSCVARTFRAAKVPAFDGSPMTVAKSFTIN